MKIEYEKYAQKVYGKSFDELSGIEQVTVIYNVREKEIENGNFNEDLYYEGQLDEFWEKEKQPPRDD